MIIVCATDLNFAELAGALLRSIAVNGDVPEAKIIVCGDRLSDTEKSWIADSASGLGVRFVDVEDRHFARFAHLKMERWTRSTLTRLLLPEILPDIAGRIVFIDVDMIVNSSLRPLFEISLDGKTIAATPNPAHPDENGYRNTLAGRAWSAFHFNAGLLVIDLDRWRALDVSRKCLDVLLRMPGLPIPDQSAINAVLGDDAVVLDRSWNFSAVNPRTFTREVYAAANIVHFITPSKPNLVECTHPAKDLFLMHRAHTPWRDRPLLTRQLSGLRRLLAFLLWKLGNQQVRPAKAREIARAAAAQKKRERL